MYKHIGRRLCTVRNNGRAFGFFVPALLKNTYTFRRETDLGEKSKKNTLRSCNKSGGAALSFVERPESCVQKRPLNVR